MAFKLPSLAFLANESVKKALIDIATLSVSGVVCVVGSSLLMQKLGGHPKAGDAVPVAEAAVAAPDEKPAEHKEEKVEAHGEKKEGEKPKAEHKGGEGKEGKEGKEAKEGNGLHQALKPVIVNLADPTTRRYAKVTFTLDLKKESLKDELEAQEPQIYDTLIKVLGNYYFKDINTSVGKEAMKEEVKNRLNAVFHDGIAGVFITEMIVQ